jgi:hypothetical protein
MESSPLVRSITLRPLQEVEETLRPSSLSKQLMLSIRPSRGSQQFFRIQFPVRRLPQFLLQVLARLAVVSSSLLSSLPLPRTLQSSKLSLPTFSLTRLGRSNANTSQLPVWTASSAGSCRNRLSISFLVQPGSRSSRAPLLFFRASMLPSIPTSTLMMIPRTLLVISSSSRRNMPT